MECCLKFKKFKPKTLRMFKIPKNPENLLECRESHCGLGGACDIAFKRLAAEVLPTFTTGLSSV
jgi:hypothetical protein